MTDIIIIGAGLAGCEAAYQIAERGFTVSLYEMRPALLTPAHKTGMLAEIVCSNSLGSENKNERVSAAGILKEELAMMDSLILSCAEKSRVPAGGALAVDRDKFAGLVTEKITSNPKITLIREEYTDIPAGISIIASGPLTSDSLAEKLKSKADEQIHFYDAVAPVVTKESIEMSKVFVSGRYGRGDDYINCPMNRDEYESFYDALVNAERSLPHDFEKEKGKYFEGCMPVEALAERGRDTLRFGPMKPRGLVDPRTGREPYAAVQLRQDNSEGTLYNLVGFQTGLKWPEQKRVFSMIPGLENADFVRLGVMHRNTSVNAPAVLDEFLRLKGTDTFLAGQITGVEGYMESTAMGLVAAINASLILNGKKLRSWPRECAVGSLIHYLITTDPKHFQPMNMNLGIFPEVKGIKGKKERAEFQRQRALSALREFFPLCL
ncbi:MAG: methylenetetrahydrofolate--tRNA-(uracil(54)-C(5))-methyltransferase (FADH(2)-oxidizing) TrmFO [Synergistaceae bacterium]|nr:methylenetetrahydrofolate--tRNA-(uracil(54)-C(5))-methyltransferase (FADH(2)-oxidizing) TrmFO [Synergistaceae bacterium]